MSLKHLQEAGVLLPEDEWGQHDLHTSVNKPMLVAALAVGLGSVVAMYIGAGSALTFLAGGVFIVFMAWITRISITAISVQASQFADERAQLRAEHPAEPDGGQPAPRPPVEPQ